MKFESPLPHNFKQTKPVPVAGFIFYKNNSVNTLSNILNYRAPRLVKAKQGWYIKYYYRIPVEVRHLYDGKAWYPFRFTEDMNRIKGKEREEYAETLLQSVTAMLRNGYDPFKPEKEFIINENAGIDASHAKMNITDALLLFLSVWKDRGLEETSYKKYERYVNRFIEWLKYKRIPYREASAITQDNVEDYLSHTKKRLNLSNREYNNNFDFIRTAFNYLVKKKIIPDSPCAGIEKQKTKATKHRFYDSKPLEDITRALKENDPYTYLAFQTVYYLCVRSDKELMNLKVGNINWEQSVIFVEVSKTDQRYIPMDDHIKALFKEYIKDAPQDYYIFGINERPAEKPFGRGFFAKRFRKVRDAAGVDKMHTIYGAKHTRIIHLKQDGILDADIMSLTGHKSYDGYCAYLRDLGMTANIRNVNAKSRKV